MKKYFLILILIILLVSCSNKDLNKIKNRLYLKKIKEFKKYSYDVSWLDDNKFAYSLVKNNLNYIQTYNLINRKKQTINPGIFASWSDDKNIFYSDNRKVYVYNMKNKKETKLDNLSGFYNIALSSNSKKLLLYKPKDLFVYNLEQEKLSKVKPPKDYFITKFTWSKNPKYVYIQANFSALKGPPSLWLLNIETNKYRLISRKEEYDDSSSITRDGKLIAWISGDFSKTLAMDELSSGKSIYKKTFSDPIQEVTWSKNNRKIAVTFLKNDFDPYVVIYKINNIK